MTNIEIETLQITKTYDTETVVNNLSLNIPSGSIYGFLGPNGAGKTTTMRMLVGLIKPDDGIIRYRGKELQKHKKAILKNIGCFIDTPSYYPHLTGYENLKYIQKVINLPISEVDRVLDVVNLTFAKNKKVKEYSLGMRQRLGLAFSLLNDPDIIILDEPTNGLDPEGIHEIRNLLINLSKYEKKTIIVSSHNLAEIESMATHIGMINQGNMIYEGTLRDLYEKTSNEYTLIVNEPEKVKEILNSHSITYRENLNDIVMQTNPEAAAELNKIFANHGIKVFELTQSKKTLEDVFLSLTGKGSESV
ncbi:ABC transporter ATP-binding protein [Gracilibacillus sp. S3-1-1]|uniref:ABC transporter ATP-binding protein n=1 Tax=Gracilibacillus pellucidus TaxID=3095368 RepID=A0ACC6M957_9BACI|nr:ABC transporter ATP-binding protein [Gracilibacillus sp. S3-1-1]MDX8047307.1 ABC transporter ATP-binding protein [Gracilibacillus sp. S3-1-1]